MTEERIAAIQALWLDALQQIAGRAAHEIKGALNGVCVNLEVVRSRASAAGSAPASAISRFAQAAAEQMEELVAMNEALLALTRRPRDVVDVVATARQLVALLGASARSEGGELLLVQDKGSGSGVTAAPAAAVRFILASAFLRALENRTATTTCRVATGDGMVIRIEQGAAIALEAAVTQVAAESGIGVEIDPAGISLTFPRAGRPSGRWVASTRELA